MADQTRWDDIVNPKPAGAGPSTLDGQHLGDPAADPAPAARRVELTPTYSPPNVAAPAPLPVDVEPLPPLIPPVAHIPTAPTPMNPESTPPPPAPAPALIDPEPVVPVAEQTPEQSFPVTATARFTPREDDDPFAALFGSATEPPPVDPSYAPARATVAPTPPVPQSRREAKSGSGDRGVDGGGSGSGGGGGGSNGGGAGSGGGKPRKKRRIRLMIALPLALLLAVVGGVGAYGWFNYNSQVRTLLGLPLPVDYSGTGNGEKVIVTIHSGDIGSDIARKLHDQGVTLTFGAFYSLLVAQAKEPVFQPGNYSLQKQMSAQSALTALLDSKSRVTDKLLITEGTVLANALEIIAGTTGISLADLKAASLDLASFGLPAEAPSLEGYLFPATYQPDPGLSAHGVLKLLVDTMFKHLDTAGVAVADRHRVLTLASMIQREAGSNKTDFYKVSRVFTNRLAQGMNLESDATVAYGTGNLHTVWTTDAERANKANPYNTYANPGLPAGPIGLPGDLAIDAALHPVDGPWLYFVPINLATGETVFSTTVTEHNAAVAQLRAWCNASTENGTYCK